MDFTVSLIIFISLLLRSDADLADAFVGSVLAYFFVPFVPFFLSS